jgi:phage protein D
LEVKYSGFTVPAYKITADGTELSNPEFIIDDISVDLSMRDVAGACRFSVYYVYEPGSRKVDAAALSSLKPGVKVAVSLGYGSSLTEVFTGYICELKLTSAGGNTFLTVCCLDARGLMRDGSVYAMYKDKKMKDIAEAILDSYSPLISSKDVTLAALEQNVYIAHGTDDLDFICSAAKARGAYFYIDCGKAVIGAADSTVCIEFEWEQLDMDFSVKYLDTAFTGRGYNHSTMEEFSATAAAKQSAEQSTLITVSSTARLEPYLYGDSAKTITDSKAAVAKREAISGKIFCQGIPEPKLGQKVRINNFPMAAAAGNVSKFTVISVKHSMETSAGYVTEIGIEGG